mmetsp:Transcript_19315/g.38598  ORF Transcript_19315/g.38598 Transcript_19315/m.38598 type:complete len:281 (+) Transcript_19315:36-878(+)
MNLIHRSLTTVLLALLYSQITSYTPSLPRYKGPTRLSRVATSSTQRFSGLPSSAPSPAAFDFPPPSPPATLVTLAIALSPTEAIAAGPDWGLFEGKTGSLLHPFSMACLFGFSVYTGLLGFKWRRQREIGPELKDLESALKSLGPVDPESGPTPSQASAASAVAALKSERSVLSSEKNNQRHFSSGSLLAFLGTFFAIEGPLNTYARAGKLFPGPHLYAGAALVVLWAGAAACVPGMQKGNDTARSLHIGLNGVATGLFGWQVVTGWPILLKVWEKTQWP